MTTTTNTHFGLLSRRINIPNLFLLLIMLLLLSPNSFAAEKKTLYFQSLGIETYEDGKKTCEYQQWDIKCNCKSPIPDCDLKQTIFRDCPAGLKETVVFQRSRSTKDKTITVREFDLKKGRIDFSIHYGFHNRDKESSECVLTFDPNCASFGCKTKSLECRMIHRGFFDNSLQTVEDKLVEKTFYWKPKCGFLMRGTDD